MHVVFVSLLSTVVLSLTLILPYLIQKPLLVMRMTCRRPRRPIAPKFLHLVRCHAHVRTRQVRCRLSHHRSRRISRLLLQLEFILFG